MKIALGILIFAVLAIPSAIILVALFCWLVVLVICVMTKIALVILPFTLSLAGFGSSWNEEDPIKNFLRTNPPVAMIHKAEAAYYAEERWGLPLRYWSQKATEIEPPALNVENAHSLARRWAFTDRLCYTNLDANKMNRYAFWMCSQTDLAAHIEHQRHLPAGGKEQHEKMTRWDHDKHPVYARLIEASASCLQMNTGKAQCLHDVYAMAMPPEDKPKPPKVEYIQIDDSLKCKAAIERAKLDPEHAKEHEQHLLSIGCIALKK